MTVTDGLVVSLDYTLRLEDEADVIDTSEGREPLQFVQGQGQIIPGLEQELYGMAVGQEKTVVVPPSLGYGDTDPEAYQIVPLDAFPTDMVVEPGIGLQLQTPDGQTFEAYVGEVREDGVVLDFNHPLAGRTLRFNVRIAALRPATQEERAHGHVHGAGHHEEDEFEYEDEFAQDEE